MELASDNYHLLPGQQRPGWDALSGGTRKSPEVPMALPITETRPADAHGVYPIRIGMQPTSRPCRSCGKPFQRRPGLLPTSDEYFRCTACRGETVVGAVAACCTVQ